MDFVNMNLRDSRTENEIVRQLRSLSEQEAADSVKQLIARDTKIGLRVANRVLRTNAHFETLFREGLLASNESTVRYWIEWCGPRIGIRRVIELVGEAVDQDLHAVERAAYWLSQYAASDQRANAALEDLHRKLVQRRPHQIL